jgi:spore coat polysaccharide biosynthesis protein SpsF (cytidylyltransferase family)
VYKEFFGDPPELLKIINWLDQNPEIRDINKNIIVKDLDSSVNVLLKGD